jgi:hypothetical protein
MSLPDSTAPSTPLQTQVPNTSIASDPSITEIAASMTTQPKGNNGGLIAAGVFGGIVGVGIIGAMLAMWTMRRRIAKKLQFSDNAHELESAPPATQSNEVSVGPWRIPEGVRLYVCVSIL